MFGKKTLSLAFKSSKVNKRNTSHYSKWFIIFLLGVVLMAKITNRACMPHFVIPIMPRELQENIAIPKSFMRNYLIGEKSPRKATLRTIKSGNSWKVSLKGLHFEDGWDDFSRAHDLQVGDFLVFKHEGGLTFYVTVFDASECEKDYPSMNIPNDQQKTKKVATTKKKMKKISKNFSRSKGTERQLADPRHFTVTLGPYFFKESILCIPMDFSRANGLDNPSMVTLEDPKGRCWEVSLRCKQTIDQAYLRVGMREFSDANKLKLGDECTFKLLSPKESKKIVMEVSFSRYKH